MSAPPRRTLGAAELDAPAARLRAANLDFARRYPGEGASLQPVHTVYGGAQFFTRDVVAEHRDAALLALREHAPDADTFAAAIGLDPAMAETVYQRVLERLRSEPVEDFRIDFEDGYGVRPDAEEDARAVSAAEEVAAAMAAGTLPRFIGLRLKTLSEEMRERAVGTLDLFVTALLAAAGRLPEGLRITLPKVTIPEQATFLVRVLEMLEQRLGLETGRLGFEAMLEVPQAVIGPRGDLPLARILDAAEGRLTGLHFGTYDYTTGVGVTAAHQGMRHKASDFARHVMQVTLAGTGVWLSDGSTALLPVAPEGVSGEAARAAVHRAWRAHFEDVRHSLVNAFYQGWDLHPAQLPTRFAAVFSFYLEGRDAAAQRLGGFMERLSRAGAQAAVADDAATGQALLNFFLRGIAAGAFTREEIAAATGLTAEELSGIPFAAILRARQG